MILGVQGLILFLLLSQVRLQLGGLVVMEELAIFLILCVVMVCVLVRLSNVLLVMIMDRAQPGK